jgi:hypothetical protein
MTGSASNSSFPAISRSVASGALALLQSPEAVSIDLGPDDPVDQAALAILLQRALRRHQVSSVLTRIPFGQERSHQILGPGQGIPSKGAVLLAFHIGAKLDVALITPEFDLSETDAGRELYSARAALIGTELNSCAAFQSSLGRYDDGSLPREEMLGLINHTRACGDCRVVLDEFQSLDDRLREVAANSPEVAPVTPGQIKRYSNNSLLLWTPILLVVIVAIAILLLTGSGSPTPSGGASLLPVSHGDEHRGWLIVSSEREVMALDLERGERRRLLENPAHDWWNPWIISPDRELVVRWEEHSRVEDRVGALRAYDMSGQRAYLHRWSSQRARTFSGWLGDRTVLFSGRGPIPRVGVDSEVPDEMAPSLIAADLQTGEEWIVYQGHFDKAVPSPDGRYLALVRPAPASWPGKTVDIVNVTSGDEPEIVASLEHRHLSWPGRMIWSQDSTTVYFSAIEEHETPDQIPSSEMSGPGLFDFQRLLISGLGTDGTVAVFDLTSEQQWVVPQAINDEGTELTVVVNESADREASWLLGTLDVESGRLDVGQQAIAGSRWWNSESVWAFVDQRFYHQEIDRSRFLPDGDERELRSLTLGSGDSYPGVVFQDTGSLDLRPGVGLGLLGWVPDEVMNPGPDERAERPTLTITGPHAQANATQSLTSSSSIAPTGRYVLLRQQDPDSGERDRLLHLQAWGGTESEREGVRDLSWLPREPAAIGAADPDNDSGSRLVFVATDRNSPLHGLEIDPARLGDSNDLRYGSPSISQSGEHLIFLVMNSGSEVQLWLDAPIQEATMIDTWVMPDDRRLDPEVNLIWLSDDIFVFTRVSNWDRGYSESIEVVRGIVDGQGTAALESIRMFNAAGRDRGIELRDLTVSPNGKRFAIRVRSFTGSDPNQNARDAIHVSYANDLTESLEIVRSAPGEGLIWLGSEDWLVAGLDDRIALLDWLGRDRAFLTESSAAYPVLISEREIWYQDLTDDGSIMRVTVDQVSYTP